MIMLSPGLLIASWTISISIPYINIMAVCEISRPLPESKLDKDKQTEKIIWQ